MLFSRSRDAPSLLLHPQGMNQPIAEGTVVVMVGRVVVNVTDFGRSEPSAGLG